MGARQLGSRTAARRGQVPWHTTTEEEQGQAL